MYRCQYRKKYMKSIINIFDGHIFEEQKVIGKSSIQRAIRVINPSIKGRKLLSDASEILKQCLEDTYYETMYTSIKGLSDVILEFVDDVDEDLTEDIIIVRLALGRPIKGKTKSDEQWIEEIKSRYE